MRLIAVLAAVLAGLSLCGCGGSPGAPWCAHYSSGLNDCSFYSYRQCTDSLSGPAAFASLINRNAAVRADY